MENTNDKAKTFNKLNSSRTTNIKLKTVILYEKIGY